MDEVFTKPRLTEVSEETVFPFEFRGSAQQYFAIWIVNLLLSIVTLGIYSAWAQVRTRRYFYGNTSVAGASFEYHADPLRILYGRLIALAVLALLALLSQVSVAATLTVIALIILILPWVTVRASMFHLSQTGYRNIRFGFNENYADSYKAFFIALAAHIFTLGLGYPYALYRIIAFRIANARYGRSQFEFTGKPGPFFLTIYHAIGILVAFVLLVSILIAMIFVILKIPLTYVVFPILVVSYLSVPIAGASIFAGLHRYTFQSTTLGGIRLESDIKTLEVLWLGFTTLLAVLATFGLATPWAAVRLHRYKTSRIRLISTPSKLNTFEQGDHSNKGAGSEAAADFLGFDIGL